MTGMQPERKPVQGNAEKYERYKKAHERLKKAIEQEFYIEAAMICESLISDRLHSHLHWRVHEIKMYAPAFYAKDKKVLSYDPDVSIAERQDFVKFSTLIRMYGQSLQEDHRPDHPQPPRWVRAAKTVSPAILTFWSYERNDVAHGAVKTHPTRKSYDQNFEQFQRRAEVCANNGKTLVRLLSDWDRAVRAASRTSKP